MPTETPFGDCIFGIMAIFSAKQKKIFNQVQFQTNISMTLDPLSNDTVTMNYCHIYWPRNPASRNPVFETVSRIISFYRIA